MNPPVPPEIQWIEKVGAMTLFHLHHAENTGNLGQSRVFKMRLRHFSRGLIHRAPFKTNKLARCWIAAGVITGSDKA